MIIKGGHADTPDIVDLLFQGGTFTEFRHERVPGTSTHGTGCTFSAAITAQLALGRGIQEAIPLAQEYVARGHPECPGARQGARADGTSLSRWQVAGGQVGATPEPA